MARVWRKDENQPIMTGVAPTCGAVLLHSPREDAMSLFPTNRWEDWAHQWGLIHVPTSPWRGNPEVVAGVRKGLLILAIWRFGRASRLTIRVRFPQVEDVEVLKARIVGDSSLDALPGGLRRRDQMIVVTKARGLMIRRSDYFLWPNQLEWSPGINREDDETAREIPQWSDAIVDALIRTTSPFKTCCEDCSSQTDPRAVLVKEEVKLLCPSCRQKCRGLVAEAA